MTEEPTPPASVPTEVVEPWPKLSPPQLRDLAEYAETLAAHRERQARRETDRETPEKEPDDRPEDVPSGASVTIKEINDNRYRYWQWRDGEKVKSKYIGPVNGSR